MKFQKIILGFICVSNLFFSTLACAEASQNPSCTPDRHGSKTFIVIRNYTDTNIDIQRCDKQPWSSTYAGAWETVRWGFSTCDAQFKIKMTHASGTELFNGLVKNHTILACDAKSCIPVGIDEDPRV